MPEYNCHALVTQLNLIYRYPLLKKMKKTFTVNVTEMIGMVKIEK